jgi:hypothetical protein
VTGGILGRVAAKATRQLNLKINWQGNEIVDSEATIWNFKVDQTSACQF